MKSSDAFRKFEYSGIFFLEDYFVQKGTPLIEATIHPVVDSSKDLVHVLYVVKTSLGFVDHETVTFTANQDFFVFYMHAERARSKLYGISFAQGKQLFNPEGTNSLLLDLDYRLCSQGTSAQSYVLSCEPDGYEIEAFSDSKSLSSAGSSFKNPLEVKGHIALEEQWAEKAGLELKIVEE
ncbi:MAG: hypothetical protein ACMXYK_04145 [Candidatus Woesearchaeota archaeon]